MPEQGVPPTVDSSHPPDKQRRAAVVRWGFIVALVAFLGAALLGVFGLKDETTTATSGPYKLEVQYTAVSRSGLRGGLNAKITLPPGTSDPVTLALDSRYVDMLDITRVVPQPVEETTSSDAVLWQFDPPAGSELDVDIDADIPPNRHRGASGTIALRVKDRDVVAVKVKTRVFP